jgi:hypothetical protein
MTTGTTITSILFRYIADTESVDGVSLSEVTQMSHAEVMAWLAKHAAAGYLHRDEVTGRYATSCPLPRIA